MDESRLISFDRVTETGRVSETPCLIHSICGIGIAQTSNVYTIYDGQSNAGKVMMRLVAAGYASDFRLFAAPLYFSKGIYVEFTTNGEEVVIQYMQLAR